MDKSSSPPAPPPSMVNMSSSPPLPPSSQPSSSPSLKTLSPADQSDFVEANRNYLQFCRIIWDQFLRQNVMAKGLKVEDMKPEDLARLRQWVATTAKSKAKELTRIKQQKRFQQRQLLEHSHAHGHGHSPTPTSDLSHQLPLPAFIPQPASSPVQSNTFQPVRLGNQAPHQHGDQTLPTPYQPASSPVLSVFQPDTPTPAPLNRMPLLTMPLTSPLSGAENVDDQANNPTSTLVAQMQEIDQNQFSYFRKPSYSPTDPELHPTQTNNQQTPAFSEPPADDSLQDTKIKAFPAEDDADNKHAQSTWENDLFGDSQQGQPSSSPTPSEVQYQGIMVPYNSLAPSSADNSPLTNPNHSPLESIQEIGARINAALFLTRKQLLSTRIHQFNAETFSLLGQPGYPAANLIGVHNIAVALADVINHASGLANLREVLNYPRQYSREKLVEQVRLAAQNVPVVMPQAQAYVRMWLTAMNDHRSRWSTGSRTMVEVYHIFSSLKSSLHKLDREATEGVEVLVDELGVTRAEVWAWLAPVDDDDEEL